MSFSIWARILYSALHVYGHGPLWCSGTAKDTLILLLYALRVLYFMPRLHEGNAYQDAVDAYKD